MSSAAVSNIELGRLIPAVLMQLRDKGVESLNRPRKPKSLPTKESLEHKIDCVHKSLLSLVIQVCMQLAS